MKKTKDKVEKKEYQKPEFNYFEFTIEDWQQPIYSMIYVLMSIIKQEPKTSSWKLELKEVKSKKGKYRKFKLPFAYVSFHPYEEMTVLCLFMVALHFKKSEYKIKTPFRFGWRMYKIDRKGKPAKRGNYYELSERNLQKARKSVLTFN